VKQYSQMTYEQRCQLSALNKRGCSQREIAEIIGVSQSTVSREQARNKGKRGYRHKQAQEKAKRRRQEARKAHKMTPELIEVIEAKIREEWSPEQISGWLLEENEQLISHESIYRHIWADRRAGGDLYQSLRRQGKKYDKRRHGKPSRGQIKNRVSIDERPEIVENKGRIGDWEIDTMIGKGHSGAMVTLVERATMFTLAAQVNSKNAAEVTAATIALLKPFEDIVHSITADNGKEFAYHETISQALSADVYFAHPYSSWERGLNENTNGLLRQYFPKDTDFKKVSSRDVDHALNRLNTRPRKGLDFKTPSQLIDEYNVAVAA